ncbi:aminoglycoside phosphotransferase family protein [Halobacillus salinus]|uniref:Aminoglycoside phosphotransferase family protein n=1 Tax=Halobacillus salinus TaxID=192814 RepID=A0A4Z0H4R7_9BACI|nr:aminoglycoside phosphotransferase family protein [Halobacillus salinus]TGB04185.1 aminoglycoside phosphotransferase family protein [Halobacillus salinus]
MRSNQRKGDSYTDRLFHWLKYEEELPIKLTRTIKPKVYEIRFQDTPMILKGYRRPHVLEQQIEFFRHWNYASNLAARPLPFHQNTYTKSKLGCEWGLFEWIEGHHSSFEKQKDCQSVIHVLRQFHRTSKGIAVLAIPKDPLYIKWERRLEQFEDTRDVFLDYRRIKLFDELRDCMLKQLDVFSNHPWGELEERAWDSHEWLHGDVAHHNFIVEPGGSTKMIDFDLLHTGPVLYDYIQLGQRFLPHFYENKDQLFSLFTFVENRKLWLQGVRVPADLLREWLFSHRKSIHEDLSLSKQVKKLEKAWQKRKLFVQSTDSML